MGARSGASAAASRPPRSRSARALGARTIVTSGERREARAGARAGAPTSRSTTRRRRRRRGQGGDRQGVHVVVETVGEATWAALARGRAPGGRVVVCGATSGPNPPARCTASGGSSSTSTARRWARARTSSAPTTSSRTGRAPRPRRPRLPARRDRAPRTSASRPASSSARSCSRSRRRDCRTRRPPRDRSGVTRTVRSTSEPHGAPQCAVCGEPDAGARAAIRDGARPARRSRGQRERHGDRCRRSPRCRHSVAPEIVGCLTPGGRAGATRRRRDGCSSARGRRVAPARRTHAGQLVELRSLQRVASTTRRSRPEAGDASWIACATADRPDRHVGRGEAAVARLCSLPRYPARHPRLRLRCSRPASASRMSPSSACRRSSGGVRNGPFEDALAAALGSPLAAAGGESAPATSRSRG